MDDVDPGTPPPDAPEPPVPPEAPVDPTPVDPTPVDVAAPAEPVAEEGRAQGGDGPDFVELALASVELSQEGVLPATGTVSMLDLAGGGRLDIVMARADAVLVQDAIAGTSSPRPRTSELLLAAVEALGGAVTAVTLVERRAGGLYVANLRVTRPDGTSVELDARPSDALNVALRSTGAVLRAARSLVDVPAN